MHKRLLSFVALFAAMACKTGGSDDDSSELQDGAATPTPIPADAAAAGFDAYVGQYATPHLLLNNDNGLAARIKLLDNAPAGAHVTFMTFVWETGKTTQRLAGHVCKAAQRGVKVDLLVDNMYGSIVDDDTHPFNHPPHEEMYKYLATCGARVRVYNFIGPSLGIVNPLGQWQPNSRFLAEVAADPRLAAINRLNHRKLFMVENGTGEQTKGCMILGGRNIGDHYLAFEDLGDNLHDGDVLVCRQHLQGQDLDIFARAHASFDELWNDYDRIYSVAPDPQFRYKHIWFSEVTNNLDVRHPVLLIGRNFIDTIAPTERVVVDNKIDLTAVRANFMPAAVPLPEPQKAVLEIPLEQTFGWRLLKAGWVGEPDEIRAELLAMIDREQEEIYLETAFMTIDDELEQHLLQAMARGVRFQTVANSFGTFEMRASPIRIINEAFFKKATALYGSAGLVSIKLVTPEANHMIHFKGAAFRCQKTTEGGKTVALARNLIGSHNIHKRSGTSDKEHALIWSTVPSDSCLAKVGAATVDRSVYGGRTAPPLNFADFRARYYSELEKRLEARGIKATMPWQPLSSVAPSFAARTIDYVLDKLEPAWQYIEPYL